jgi:PPOX class probable F420-dependent enzyme
MTKLPDPIREALTAGHLAHLVTINPDGSPHVTIVWIGMDGDEIVSGHIPFHRKLRNVRRDPRVSLSVELGGHNEMGLANYLVVEGTARITEGGAPDLLQRLATIYIGPGVKFPPFDNPPSGYVLRITPRRAHGTGIDPWTSDEADP